MNKEKIFIGVAWPYANGLQHIGHIAGAYLPSDIFARFQRLRGKEVLMVSGSDSHGTPVSIKADEMKVKPIEVVYKYHNSFIESYKTLGISFDLFTTTHTTNHETVVHEFFKEHLQKKIIYKEISKQLYDPIVKRFLPDRYIEGICPFCKAVGARGDQCDNCGKTYDAIELINPVSKLSGTSDLKILETEHFYLDLSKFKEQLLQWVMTHKKHWRHNVFNFTKGELEKRQLQGRPITRDLDWGISIPIEGYDNKCIYVWYEAVIGYLSASIQWSSLIKDPTKWQEWWDINNADNIKSYYFIGKDNIIFHTIIWPAMLMATKKYVLPYDVPSNEYLNCYGRKFSKSRGKAIYILDMLQKYQPDAIRYALTAMAPESSDVNFTWEDFIEKVNNELVANWGNLVNRVLSFTYKNFNSKIPTPLELSEEDKKILEDIHKSSKKLESLYENIQLKNACEEIQKLCQKVNQYLNNVSPWSVIKYDPNRAQTSLYVAIQCIYWINIMFAPILPHTAQNINYMLGKKDKLFGEQFTQICKDDKGEFTVLRYDNSQAKGKWVFEYLDANLVMQKPSPPFVKLDATAVLKETL